MNQIDDQFDFKLIGNDDFRENVIRNRGEEEKWKMSYFEEKDFIIAFRVSHPTKMMDVMIDCLHYEFGSDHWSQLCSFGGYDERRLYMKYQWNVCFDGYQSMYFVSSEYHVVRCAKNWKMLRRMGDNHGVKDDRDQLRPPKSAPIIWTNPYARNVLMSVRSEGNRTVFRVMNVRNDNPKWVSLDVMTAYKELDEVLKRTTFHQ